MYLTELFNKSQEWEYAHPDGDHLLAYFMIDEYRYNVELRNGEGDYDVSLGGPEEHLVGVWEAAFTQHSSREGAKDTLTGTGNSLVVMATVIEILTYMIKDNNIQTVSFTADNTEPSRVKLYDRLAKYFEKKGWRYISNKELDARSEFYNDEVTAADDVAAGRGYSHFLLTNQPHPHSLMRGTKAHD